RVRHAYARFMDIDPRRLRVLREVHLRGGVTRAAEALYLTASAVSQQLAQLEREVGLALIDRSQWRVSLTPAGRVLAGYAERVEEELAERSEEHTSELQSREKLVCRLLHEKYNSKCIPLIT